VKPQHDPSLIDKVPPSIVSAAMAVSNWFNSQSLHPSPRWEFLSICSRNHADRLKKLERELNAANTIIRQQQLLDEANLRLQERIKRLEREIELLRLYGNKDCTAMADEALSKEAKP
jgi:rRNA maturation protein Rpf1